jgi:hypothetical protein
MAIKLFMKLHLKLLDISQRISTVWTQTRAVGLCWVRIIFLISRRSFDHQCIDPTTDKKNCVNLTSLFIKEGTIPNSWPLANILEAGDPETPSCSSVDLEVEARSPETPSHSPIELGKRTREKRKRTFKLLISL